MKESEFYREIEAWLGRYLRSRYRRFDIIVEDTHRVRLSSFLRRKGLLKFFPEGVTYEIMPDITGVALREGRCLLFIVECKAGVITLRDIAQILGYSIICKPAMSFIISPVGASDSFRKLIREYARSEILEYAPGSYIHVLKYDTSVNGIDYSQSIVL